MNKDELLRFECLKLATGHIPQLPDRMQPPGGPGHIIEYAKQFYDWIINASNR